MQQLVVLGLKLESHSPCIERKATGNSATAALVKREVRSRTGCCLAPGPVAGRGAPRLAHHGCGAKPRAGSRRRACAQPRSGAGQGRRACAPSPHCLRVRTRARVCGLALAGEHRRTEGPRLRVRAANLDGPTSLEAMRRRLTSRPAKLRPPGPAAARGSRVQRLQPLANASGKQMKRRRLPARGFAARKPQRATLGWLRSPQRSRTST